MQNWEEDDRGGPAAPTPTASDAVAVCGRLGIPFHARNFSARILGRRVRAFPRRIRAGRTPNPDVLCNREIKFKTFLDEAHALGAEKIATGHYARVDAADGRWRLLRGARHAARTRAISCTRWASEQLAATLFPLGDLQKREVRALAREAGLPTSAKKDSTGICFIGERDFRGFLARYLPAQPGEMRTPEGECVGTHQGVMYYTLGQRNGLGIGGRHGGSGDAGTWSARTWPPTCCSSPRAAKTNGCSRGACTPTIRPGLPARHPLRTSAALRARVTARATRIAWSALAAGGIDVHFDEAQRAVTPGQSVVLYAGAVCLGGAVITATDAAFGGLAPAGATSLAGDPPYRV